LDLVGVGDWDWAVGEVELREASPVDGAVLNLGGGDIRVVGVDRLDLDEGQVVEEGLVESDFAVWREEGEGDVVLASKKVGLESLVEPHKPVAGKVEVLEARLKLADQEEEVVEEAYLVGMGRKRVEVCFAVPVLKMDMWACVEVQKLPHFFSPSALSFGLFARFRPCLTPFSESAVHHSSPYG
jgi:hypothetical protein